jgi:hypothetical protein
MGTTYLHAVASLDGYIADERDDVGRSTTGISTATIPSSTKTTRCSRCAISGLSGLR